MTKKLVRPKQRGFSLPLHLHLCMEHLRCSQFPLSLELFSFSYKNVINEHAIEKL